MSLEFLIKIKRLTTIALLLLTGAWFLLGYFGTGGVSSLLVIVYYELWDTRIKLRQASAERDWYQHRFYIDNNHLRPDGVRIQSGTLGGGE